MPEPAPDLRDLIEKVKERIEIETVIGRRVQLQRRGSRLVGLCPFHPEKTPSFHVTPDKGFFKCFGCGKGGDVLSFVQEIDGLSFIEALRLLAEEAGVELPNRAADRLGRDLRQEAREALRQARALYRDALATPAGAPARDYLAGRGVAAVMLEEFAVGWAPAEPGWLGQRLRGAGLSEQALLEAGLAYRPEGGGPLRDRFWDRVMFPVADRAGRTVGFGGRVLPGSRGEAQGMGKYVNSPEGPLFPKRRLLYGLDRLAKALRESAEAPILLCEGYLDVVMLHQAGFRTAVAVLGTSLTEEHARALRRADRPLALMLDPDDAGRRAAARAGRLLVADGATVRVVELPEGLDPADMVAAGRREELAERLSQAWDILDWRLEAWVRKADFRDPPVRSRAAQEAAEWIQATPHPALAEIWTRRAGDRLGLTEESLRRMVRPPGGFAAPPAGSPAGPPSHSVDPASEVLARSARNEREILAALLHDPSLYPRHLRILEVLDLQDPVATEALIWCRQRRQQGLLFDLAHALQAFAGGAIREWLDRVRLARPADCARVLEEALRMLPANREEEHRVRPRDPGADPSDEQLARLQRKIRISSADDGV